MPSPPLRAVSRRLGRQLLRAATRVWPTPVLDAVPATAGRPAPAVALGAVVAAAGWRRRPTPRCRSLHHLVGGRRPRRPCGCSGSTRSASPRCRPPGAAARRRSRGMPRDRAVDRHAAELPARGEPAGRDPRRAPRDAGTSGCSSPDHDPGQTHDQPRRRPHATASSRRPCPHDTTRRARRPADRGRCGSASAGRSAAARRRSSAACAGCFATSCRSSSSPTTSSPPRTPRHLRAHGRAADERIVAGRDRLLPAHRDPRRHRGQPRRRRAARGGARARRPDARRERVATTSPRSSAAASSTCRSS